jgi:hypothetical protein
MTYEIPIRPRCSGLCAEHCGAPETAAAGHLARILHAIETVDAWLDEAAPAWAKQDSEASRVANMYRRAAAGPASEGQEIVDAINGMTGGNPRKGVCKTPGDVLAEGGDTAVAALLFIQSQVKDIAATWDVFTAALDKALGRVPS